MTNDELQLAADTEADDCIRYLSSLPPIEIRNRISNALRDFYVAGVQEGRNTSKLSVMPRRT
jgi:hypothetical protein